MAQSTPTTTDAQRTDRASETPAKPDAVATDQRSRQAGGDRPGSSGEITGERWRSGSGLATRSGGEVARPAESHAEIGSDQGTTRIADVVVAKIAGMATQEIPGVHSMGKGLARRIGQMRARVPGQGATPSITQGVSVEVGQKEAAVDLEVVTWYGEDIVTVTEAVRANVTEQIEAMTGLKVVEVNIHVVDIHVDGDEDSTTSRVE